MAFFDFDDFLFTLPSYSDVFSEGEYDYRPAKPTFMANLMTNQNNQYGEYFTSRFDYDFANGSSFITVRKNSLIKNSYMDKMGNAFFYVRPMIRLTPDVYELLTRHRFNGNHVFLGFYPKSKPSEEVCEFLERNYKNAHSYDESDIDYDRDLIKTERKYIIPEPHVIDKYRDEYSEYEYQGKRYVRYIYYNKLSRNYEYVWLEVERVEWICNDKAQTLLCTECLASGVMMGRASDEFRPTSFYGSNLWHFVSKCMAEAILWDYNKLMAIKNLSMILDRIIKNNNENALYYLNSLELLRRQLKNLRFASETEEKLVNAVDSCIVDLMIKLIKVIHEHEISIIEEKLSEIEKEIAKVKKNYNTDIIKATSLALDALYKKTIELKNLIKENNEIIDLLTASINEAKKELSKLEKENKKMKEKLKLLKSAEKRRKKEAALINGVARKIVKNNLGRYVNLMVSHFAILTGTKINDPLESRLIDTGAVRIGDTEILYNESGILWDEEFKYFAIKPIIRSKVIYDEAIKRSKRNSDGLLVCEYGEYPCEVASKKEQGILNDALKTGKGISLTKDSYTIILDGKTVSLPVYEYGKDRYVLLPVDVRIKNTKLSNGISYKNGDSTWVKIKPVEWIIDEETESLISLYGVIGNIPSEYVKFFVSNILINEIIRSEGQKTNDFDEEMRILETIGKVREIISKIRNNPDGDNSMLIKELEGAIRVLNSENVNTSNMEIIIRKLKRN